jgi:hypothetical protein
VTDNSHRTRALLATAAMVTAIALPATAHAADTYYQFVSPTGNIVCSVGNGADGKGSAACEIRTYSWVPPHCDMGTANAWSITQGFGPGPRCHTDTNFVAGLPVLPYGQVRSAGSITCDSEPTGMKCSDASTGHFFRLARESYEIG